MVDVTLHIGAHRTGTTTFQRMLGQNGPSLRRSGLAYCGPKRTRTDLLAGTFTPGPVFLPWRQRRLTRDAGLVARALADLGAEGGGRLVVSDASFLGSIHDCLMTGRLYPDAAARARSLAQLFGPLCRRIGLAVRSYDTYWASALAFALPRGGPLPDAAMLRALVGQDRRWRHVILDVARAFPQAEIVVWRYEAMAARPDALAAALFDTDMPRLHGARNWHRAAPTAAALRGHLADLGAAPGLIKDDCGRFAPFDAAARRALQAAYADDIAWLQAGTAAQIRYIDGTKDITVAATRRKGQGHDRDQQAEQRPRRLA
ncbi:MAG: hypothetical protein AAF914_07755 [Pseudomonadota bacterium]